jgi:hypothetical protein
MGQSQSATGSQRSCQCGDVGQDRSRQTMKITNNLKINSIIFRKWIGWNGGPAKRLEKFLKKTMGTRSVPRSNSIPTFDSSCSGDGQMKLNRSVIWLWYPVDRMKYPITWFT